MALLEHQLAQPRREQADIRLGKIVGDDGAPSAGAKSYHLFHPVYNFRIAYISRPDITGSALVLFCPSAIISRTPFSTPSGFTTWILYTPPRRLRVHGKLLPVGGDAGIDAQAVQAVWLEVGRQRTGSRSPHRAARARLCRRHSCCPRRKGSSGSCQGAAHVYLVEAELAVGVYREPARPAAVVAHSRSELYRVVHCDEKGLFGMDIAVIAEIFHVSQPVAARVFRHVAPHRLPQRFQSSPVWSPDVIVVRGRPSARRSAETRDAVVFRYCQRVSARRVVEHAVHVPTPDIVCPRRADQRGLSRIRGFYFVKMAILHIVHLIIKFTLFYNYIISARITGGSL